VAIASWRVARGSLRLAESIAADRVSQDKQRLRLALADRIYAWSALRWAVDAPSKLDPATRHAELGRLSIALTDCDVPGSKDLQEVLWAVDKVRLPTEITGLKRAIALTYLAGACARTTEMAVITWLREPEKLGSLLEEHLANVGNLVSAAEASAVRHLEQLTADLDEIKGEQPE